jgi:hypothetical protein
VAAAIAQALNVKDSNGRPPIELLKDYLRAKQLLLLLDNFEQVATATPLVAATTRRRGPIATRGWHSRVSLAPGTARSAA